MDLNTVRSYRFARTRDDLALAPGERFLGGGTWLFSEPQTDTTGLVDLSAMGWPALEYRPEGLRIGATCTIAELADLPERAGWLAHPLFFQSATALLASHKIWNIATVGGNICRSFAGAAMVSLCVALDGAAIIWTPDGGERRLPVAQLITGNGLNNLAAGDVLRAVDIPDHALRASTGFRKIALATLGRSGAGSPAGSIRIGRPCSRSPRRPCVRSCAVPGTAGCRRPGVGCRLGRWLLHRPIGDSRLAPAGQCGAARRDP